MEYFLSNKIFFNTHSLNEHYLGWCLLGEYYIGEEKILDNKLISDNYIDIANICALSTPEKNFLSLEDNSIVFKNSDNLRIIGKKENNGIKVKNGILTILDYGTENINIEQKITNSMGSDFENEALKKEKKDIKHIYFDNVQNVLYKQYINCDKIINTKKYTKIIVGKLKVNLEGLEK